MLSFLLVSMPRTSVLPRTPQSKHALLPLSFRILILQEARARAPRGAPPAPPLAKPRAGPRRAAREPGAPSPGPRAAGACFRSSLAGPPRLPAAAPPSCRCRRGAEGCRARGPRRRRARALAPAAGREAQRRQTLRLAGPRRARDASPCSVPAGGDGTNNSRNARLPWPAPAPSAGRARPRGGAANTAPRSAAGSKLSGFWITALLGTGLRYRPRLRRARRPAPPPPAPPNRGATG